MLGDAREMRPWAAAAAAGAVCGGAALLWYRRAQRAPEVAELRGFDLISRMAAPLAPLTAKEFVTLLQCTSRPTATYCRDVIAAAVAGGAGYRVDIEEALPALVAVGDVDWEMDIFPEPAVRFALERLGFIVARTYIADVEAALEPTATAAGNAPRAAELIGLLHERHDGHGPRYGYIRRFLVPMADAALQRRLAALRRSDRAALARYYRVALASSLPAAAVAAGLTCLSGRLALAGLRHRAVLEEGFMCGAPLPCPVPIVRALRGLGASPVVAGLAWGVAVEGGLAVAGAAVQHIHSTVVAAAAARYREARKREVVYALSRVPVGHHEVQGEDEVEQLLCYPNDLEGVEVHIVFSLFALGLAAQNAATAAAAAAAVGYSPRLLCTLCGLAFVSHRLDAWARSLSRWCARNTRDAEELGLSDARGPDDATPGGACPLPFSDPADFEDRTVRSTTAQVPLLVDTSAVEHHATLRPFAADSGLVLAWQAFAARRTTSSLRAVVLGSGAPMVQAALATLRFALPLAAVAVVSARHDGAVGPVVALDVQRGVAGVVTAVVAVAAHWETITLNAFKAAALEAVCHRAAWEPSHADPPHPDPEAVTGAVLDAVDFAYPTRPDRPVLSGATLRLPLRARTLVALTGASGCGKSTVLQLLLALRRPTAGTVALETSAGPVDVAAADVRWLRRGVFSYVPQSAAVLPASVAENVLLRRVAGGDASAVSEAEAALRKAGLGALLQTLPEGVHTPLGGGLHSVTLSGGEATRLGIARALAQGGRVLLADEPTAALDDESAAQILASFRAVADQGRCVVLVTHDERVTCCVDTELVMAV